jgi:acyl-CoA synthetase (NDP forming)
LDIELSQKKVEALTSPRNVVLVGASDRPGSWAARVWRNLNEYKFPGNIYPFNPSRKELYGQTCYGDFTSLPEKPDHLVVLVPAQHVPAILKAGAAAGARSATVFSSGFGEAFDDSATELGRQLREVIEETGLAVSGPNCMGNVSGKASFVTLTEDRPMKPGAGPVALVGQSGGVMIFVSHALEERGMKAGYLITSGNEAGLTVADYIAYFAIQDEIKVIVIYVEALKDIERFKQACRYAREKGKHIVAIKLGASEAGRNAAMAHTGSLAGSMEAFEALTGELGVARADTLDDAVELAELLAHTGAPSGRRLAAVTLSGAYRGLLLDAAERNGMEFPKLAQNTFDHLNKVLGVGSLVSNPIDGGFGVLTSKDNYLACIEALQADPNIDMILLQEALPREPGSARGESYIRMVEDYIFNKAKKPIAFVTLTTHSQTDYSRALRHDAPHVSFLQEANKALRVISVATRRRELEAMARNEVSAPAANDAQKQAAQALRAAAANAATAPALNEVRSKDILRAYGMPIAPEKLAQTIAEAKVAAKEIGYPVVLKAVSADLLHKSDAGAVQLGLAGDADVEAAWTRIEANLAKHGFKGTLDGMLVAKQVKGALELVLGLNRDPEMGLVVMAGMGGIWLELFKDVAFALPPITREKAHDMLAQTRAVRLLQGYRGSSELDIEAVVDGLVALGRIAVDLGDSLQSIDVNPFVVMPKGQGATALDALVVLRQPPGK